MKILNNHSNYRGRFAPTPSGSLHFGSIIAALGSYLQARKNMGTWLVRIDDIDQNRSVTGADKLILKQLEKLSLHWDEDIVYQSQRVDIYQAALDKLELLNCVFPCACSRKYLSDQIYPGTCRESIKKNKAATSIRIKTDNNDIEIIDQLQGSYSQCLDADVGDFIIKRADGFFAYHLATVVDDEEQNITDIVRGVDLLNSTPRQFFLQKKLNYNTPSYLHLPIAIDSSNKKISKSVNLKHININNPGEIIFNALNFLKQNPPKELITYDVKSVLDWSVENWDINLLPKKKEIIIN